MSYFTIGNDYTATDFSKVPRDATTIRCENRYIDSLKGCPRGATDINVGGTQITSLAGLPSKVERLNCNFCYKLTSLGNLPISINDLNIEGCPIDTLPKLPNLKSLNIARTKILRLPPLHGKLRYLDFQYLNLGYLPITNEDLATFPNAEHINLQECNELTSFAGCPYVKSIYCFGAKNLTLAGLPETVTEFSCGEVPKIDIRQIPSHVKSLRLFKSSIRSLAEIPESVEKLEISYTDLPNFIGASKQLKSFEYCGHIKNFYGLQEGLQKLKLSYAHVTTAFGIPETVTTFYTYDTFIRNSLVNCFLLARFATFFDSEDAKKRGFVRPSASTIFKAKLELIDKDLPFM